MAYFVVGFPLACIRKYLGHRMTWSENKSSRCTVRGDGEFFQIGLTGLFETPISCTISGTMPIF
jgi:hypothetical protein